MQDVDEFIKKLINIPIPDNPLDLTDEQLRKLSNIIGMILMVNMARNTCTPYPDFNEILRRIDTLEKAVIQLKVNPQ